MLVRYSTNPNDTHSSRPRHRRAHSSFVATVVFFSRLFWPEKIPILGKSNDSSTAPQGSVIVEVVVVVVAVVVVAVVVVAAVVFVVVVVVIVDVVVVVAVTLVVVVVVGVLLVVVSVNVLVVVVVLVAVVMVVSVMVVVLAVVESTVAVVGVVNAFCTPVTSAARAWGSSTSVASVSASSCVWGKIVATMPLAARRVRPDTGVNVIVTTADPAMPSALSPARSLASSCPRSVAV